MRRLTRAQALTRYRKVLRFMKIDTKRIRKRRDSRFAQLIVWPRFCFLVCIISLGCSDADARDFSKPKSQYYPIDLDSVPWVPHPHIVTHPTTRVARSSREIGFTLIKGLAVDARGRIYAADWLRQRVPVINSRGELIRVIGREGAGPGEFRTVNDVDIMDDGRLLAYDFQQRRITLFPPGRDSAVKTIPVVPESGIRFLLSIPGVVRSSDPLIVGRYATTYSARDYRIRNRVDIVQTLSMSGTIRDSILAFPHTQNLVRRGDGSVSVRINPFARHGVVGVGGDRIYYGWTDTVGIRLYSPSGAFTGGFNVVYEHAPVTSDDVERALNDLDDWDEEWARDELRENTPETWPAFDTFLVDGKARVWFAIIGQGGIITRWDGFAADGEYVGSLEFPPDLELMVIRGDRAYGVVTNEFNVPRIEIYEIDWRDPTQQGAAP